MLRKVFKTGNRVVVSLPKDALDFLGLEEGVDVEVDLDREKRQIIIKPRDSDSTTAAIEPEFAHQVAEFIDQYRTALEALAK